MKNFKSFLVRRIHQIITLTMCLILLFEWNFLLLIGGEQKERKYLIFKFKKSEHVALKSISIRVYTAQPCFLGPGSGGSVWHMSRSDSQPRARQLKYSFQAALVLILSTPK